MKGLNKESILDCDELETELHAAEIKQLDEQIFLMPNYPCEFEVTFLDDYHKKHNYPLFYESYLQNIIRILFLFYMDKAIEPREKREYLQPK